jgi:quercetin dioxygenase-like cupin family protein
VHFVRDASEYEPTDHPILAAHSTRYQYVALVGPGCGSVHTGLSLNVLGPEGVILPHLHSFEESFYILEGNAIVEVGERAWQLGPGDYGVCPVGTAHAWRAAGSSPVRWLQMAAPQPRAVEEERDTFFLKGRTPSNGGQPLSSKEPGDLLGHFHFDQIPPGTEGRAASGGLKGVFLKWLIDAAFGARHHRMLLAEYQPGVSIGLHDHAFEESYFILSGHVRASLDGREYTAGPGAVLWTGVGCVHAFGNDGDRPVCWIETFSPQPPAEHEFRFVDEWRQRGLAVEA